MSDTTTTADVITIAAHDLRALRNADRIVFRRYQGADTVEAYLDARNSPTGFEQGHKITVAAMVTDYGRETWDPAAGHECFVMVHSPSVSSVWQSILRRIVKGDRIVLDWIADNNSDIIRDAGLHSDELRIRIGHANGRAETYMVDHRTGRNNSARMVRRSA